MVWCKAVSLEQELDPCKEKTTLLIRESHKLQEELSEAYRLKVNLITWLDIHFSFFIFVVH
jgi:hypothetical protein